jgi:hypothetical protein
MGDVSKKLMDQFAANLNKMLDEQGPPPDAVVETAAPSPAEPTVRKINGPAAEPVDLAGVAGPAVLKRLAPAVVAVLLLLLLLRRRR